MISRRSTIRLTAAGLVIPGVISAGSYQRVASASQEPATEMGVGFPFPSGNAAHTIEMPGPAPRLDQPVVLHWKFQSSNTYRTQRMIVSEGGVFFHTWETDHSDWAYLIRLDAATGAEQWRVRIEGEASGPLVAEGRVLVSRGSEASRAIMILDAGSGELLWEMTDPFYGWIVYKSNLFITNDTSIRSLNLQSGELNWESQATIAGGMTIADDIMVVTDGYYGDQQAFDITTGSSLWATAVSARLAGVAMADGQVFVSDSGGRLYALDAKTGETNWMFEAGFGTSGFIEVVTSGAVYMTSGGILFKIDTTTGAAKWEFAGNDTIWPVTVIDGIAYAGDLSGTMFTIDANTGAQLWSHYVGDISEELPTVVNGVAYIEFEGYVYAVGNLPEPVLIRDTTLRGAPATTAVARGDVAAGTSIERLGTPEAHGGQDWIEVTIDEIPGWIPLDAIDPATMPQEGEFEYLYVP